MGQTICCPCGNALDCDHLELVVSLTCPRCRREIALEVGCGHEQSAIAVLTVMEGPCWVGEQFIMPVEDDLIIGKAVGNWLSPESEALSDVHCRLRLSSDGLLLIEDLESDTGTWIGPQRIVRGRLNPLQSFSVGGFRFRFELQSSEGTTAVGLLVPRPREEPSSLPELGKLSGDESLLHRLDSGRFIWARSLVLAFAWLAAIHHAAAFAFRMESPWPWPACVLMGLVIGCGLTIGGRRVALVHGRLKYVAPVLLLILVVADIGWGFPGAAIASLIMAGALLTSMVLASESAAVVALLLGSASLLLAAALVVRSLIILFTSHA